MVAVSFDFSSFMKENVHSEPGGPKHWPNFGHITRNFRIVLGFIYSGNVYASGQLQFFFKSQAGRTPGSGGPHLACGPQVGHPCVKR